jgi:two-component system sensor histidine kinase NreB
VLRAKGTLPDQIPIEIAIAIYRIIEEAIVNPVKSASDAPSSIVVSVKEGQLQLLIEGAGADFEELGAQRGIGLSSIRERARIVGGSLLVVNVQGQGPQLIVRVPLVESQSNQ